AALEDLLRDEIEVDAVGGGHLPAPQPRGRERSGCLVRAHLYLLKPHARGPAAKRPRLAVHLQPGRGRRPKSSASSERKKARIAHGQRFQSGQQTSPPRTK